MAVLLLLNLANRVGLLFFIICFLFPAYAHTHTGLYTSHKYIQYIPDALQWRALLRLIGHIYLLFLIGRLFDSFHFISTAEKKVLKHTVEFNC